MERFDDTRILHEALRDQRVTRALLLACRDARLRARFEVLRASGLTVETAIEQLRGPHCDADGRPYYLSDERVRSIVYAAPGSFLLTGSASPARPPTHSGAARVVTLRMRPSPSPSGASSSRR